MNNPGYIFDYPGRKYKKTGTPDKDFMIKSRIRYYLSETTKMFDYENLPDTIPKKWLELMLQSNGHICIAEVEGKPYAFTGGLGGPPDEYYFPTIYTVANPALGISKNFEIGKDCVVIFNDSTLQGLLPMLYKYAEYITEAEISANIAAINTRATTVMAAKDDGTYRSAEKFLQDVYDGKLGVICSNIKPSLDGEEKIKALPLTTSGSNAGLTNIIEYIQYLDAKRLHFVGLNSNYNMKREAINGDEAGLNDEALRPLSDDMLDCRVEGWAAVNEMFGTDVKVSFGSVWRQKRIEDALSVLTAYGYTDTTETTETPTEEPGASEEAPESDEGFVQEETHEEAQEETLAEELIEEVVEEVTGVEVIDEEPEEKAEDEAETEIEEKEDDEDE